MYARTDACPSRCNAFTGYLQKFVAGTADQQQVYDTVGESQAALWMRQYLDEDDILIKARDRYKKLYLGKVVTPDEFEDYVRTEPSEAGACQYLTGLVAHFNSLEDYVFTPIDIECSRQIVLAGIVVRNRSIRLLEGVLAIVAINSELTERTRSRCKIKLVANTA
jgi:hypothetical protein